MEHLLKSKLWQDRLAARKQTGFSCGGRAIYREKTRTMNKAWLEALRLKRDK